jgi:regulator of sigma E protease
MGASWPYYPMKVSGANPSSEKKGWIQLTGFVLLMALMIAVTYQDIVRILTK